MSYFKGLKYLLGVIFLVIYFSTVLPAAVSSTVPYLPLLAIIVTVIGIYTIIFKLIKKGQK